MNRSIRIGTRYSPLALWQAQKIQAQIVALGYSSDLVPIISEGDQASDRPLYNMNTIGIFTRALIQAMLSGAVDIAVHSLKDLPTTLPDEVILTGCLKRGNAADVLVYKDSHTFLHDNSILATIATGSLRRRAFWKNRYPHHNITVLRGNISTRLQKLIRDNWDGAIFAQAGLERLGLLDKLASHNLKYLTLDWMIPAPAQGVIAVTALKKDKEVVELCHAWEHQQTRHVMTIEREFLNQLEGGCTAPIGAQALFKEGKVYFTGVLLSPDGTYKIEKQEATTHFNKLGIHCAQKILEQGGQKILQNIRKASEQVRK
ncbi:MAG: hydroxymethylbilane synthase [Flavobacteriales bacterium]